MKEIIRIKKTNDYICKVRFTTVNYKNKIIEDFDFFIDISTDKGKATYYTIFGYFIIANQIIEYRIDYDKNSLIVINDNKDKLITNVIESLIIEYIDECLKDYFRKIIEEDGSIIEKSILKEELIKLKDTNIQPVEPENNPKVIYLKKLK